MTHQIAEVAYVGVGATDVLKPLDLRLIPSGQTVMQISRQLGHFPKSLFQLK